MLILIRTRNCPVSTLRRHGYKETLSLSVATVWVLFYTHLSLPSCFTVALAIVFFLSPPSPNPHPVSAQSQQPHCSPEQHLCMGQTPLPGCVSLACPWSPACLLTIAFLFLFLFLLFFTFTFSHTSPLSLLAFIGFLYISNVLKGVYSDPLMNSAQHCGLLSWCAFVFQV